jgi:NADPH2:quinone reductase
MRAVVITEPGGPEVLKAEQVPDPVPAAGEVLIQVAGAGVNRGDLMQRQGHYPPPPCRRWRARSTPTSSCTPP